MTNYPTRFATSDVAISVRYNGLRRRRQGCRGRGRRLRLGRGAHQAGSRRIPTLPAEDARCPPLTTERHDIVERLATFAAALDVAALNEPVVEAAKLALIDTVGVMIVGAAHPLAITIAELTQPLAPTRFRNATHDRSAALRKHI